MKQPANRSKRQADICCTILKKISDRVIDGEPADKSLQFYFRKNKGFGSRDRRLYSAITFSWFRWAGWVEPIAGEDWAKRIALSYRLDHDEEHPVIEALDPGGDYMGSLSIAEKSEKLDRPISELVPDWLAKVIPEDQLEAYILYCQKRPPTWLRLELVNSEKIRKGIDYDFKTIPGMPEAIGLEDSGKVRALQDRWKHHVEIQDIASQCVAHAADPKAGEEWWDACCGSGGKSLHLISLMGTGEKLYATDARESALKQFKKRVHFRHGVKSGSRDLLHDPLPEKLFDGILVDAPCSGLGTWSRNPDARWRSTKSFIRNRAGIQKKILSKVSEQVKPGGKLVYAVCTVAPAETHEVIEAFLEKHEDFSPAEWTLALTGEKQSGGHQIPAGFMQADGMFIAVLKKNS
jgi:16S rRNA (cytosine967-C5)-methyltransferase